VGELFRQIATALLKHPCQAFIAPCDLLLAHANNPSDDEIDTVVQPDLMVVCDATKRDQRGIHGTPDWIIEVLSPATAFHDLVVKRHLYEKNGVLEYWLVHPVDHILSVFELDETFYVAHEPIELTGTTRSIAIPNISIDWGLVIQQLPEV
jgi:Uma2 family endonuclease